MQGAAQTANAAPSSAFEPRPPRALEHARRDDSLRPRQQAHERQPEHDEHETGDLVAPLGVDVAADRGRPGPERDEDYGEADEERDARDDDPLRATPRSPSRSASTADTADR